MPNKLALATHIGEELKVIGAGETLSAEDSAKIQDRIDKARAYLIEEGVCYWPADDIPTAVMIPLAKYMAHEVAPMFDLTYERGAEGYDELRRHSAKRSSLEPLKASYF